MDKIRIAIFGVTDKSIYIVRKELSLENVEIAVFADNNIDKCGMQIDGIPVEHPYRISEYDFDYILVSAWRSYDNIKTQLIEAGVPEEKIDLLYTKNISCWYPGIIYVKDCEIVKKIYKYSSLLLEEIRKNEKETKLWGNYWEWEPLEDKNAWYCKGTMIAHACGGIVKGIKREYSNSKEALDDSLAKGFRIIECDIYGIINGRIMLAHDGVDLYDGYKGAYSLLTLEELLAVLKQHPEVTAVLDIKWETIEDYRNIVDLIDVRVEKEQKQQIVLEVYDEPTIICAKRKGYGCFFTQYRNPEWRLFIKTIALCYKYDIHVVGFPIEIAMEPLSSYFSYFLDKNIKIFVYSTDSVDDYAVLRDKGISGIFTNYLSQKQQ